MLQVKGGMPLRVGLVCGVRPRATAFPHFSCPLPPWVASRSAILPRLSARVAVVTAALSEECRCRRRSRYTRRRQAASPAPLARRALRKLPSLLVQPRMAH